MPDPTTAAAGTFAAVFVALYVAHLLADHWIQTEHQAVCKAQPGWPGRLACAGHVAAHTTACLVVLLVLPVFLGVHLDPGRVAAGLLVSAVTHYAADRRTPLLRLARLLGNGGYLDAATVVRKPNGEPESTGPGTALMELDQSFHLLFLLVAALIIA